MPGECEFSLESWQLVVEKKKCGYTFGDDNKFYLTAVMEYTTSYEAVWGDSEEVCGAPEFCECDQTETADVKITGTSGARIVNIADSCPENTCVVDHATGFWDHMGPTGGECISDPKALTYGGPTLSGCDATNNFMVGGPIEITPSTLWISGGDTYITRGLDETTGLTICGTPAWTQTVGTATHKHWTYESDGEYLEDDGACYRCGATPDGCSWYVSVDGDWDVLLSDEILTSEMLVLCVTCGGASDLECEEPSGGSFTHYDIGAPFRACFRLGYGEITMYWTSVRVRITNTGSNTILVTWTQVEIEEDGTEPVGCIPNGTPVETPDAGVVLAPGECWDEIVERSLMGPYGTTYLKDFACTEFVP